MMPEIVITKELKRGKPRWFWCLKVEYQETGTYYYLKMGTKGYATFSEAYQVGHAGQPTEWLANEKPRKIDYQSVCESYKGLGNAACNECKHTLNAHNERTR